VPCHISVRDIEFEPLATSVRIRVTTDVPSHLFVRLSSQTPRIHKTPELRRGVQFATDVRFCFTVFEDNEQLEPGDTVVHTWLKEDWPVCTTKWLYVWGSRSGEVCVSTTAPFKYHNDGVAPEPPWGLIFHEPWSATTPPLSEWYILFLEPWDQVGARLIFFEPWTYLVPPPPECEQIFLETWDG
jgi:hypothetical protein